MADLLGSLEKIVKLALTIKEAVDTVRHNKEECQQIRTRAVRVSSLLSRLPETGIAGDPATWRTRSGTLTRSSRPAISRATPPCASTAPLGSRPGACAGCRIRYLSESDARRLRHKYPYHHYFDEQHSDWSCSSSSTTGTTIVFNIIIR